MAQRACELGRVLSNGLEAKPAREVRVGDRLRVQTERGLFEVDVHGLSLQRGPAAQAQALYRETDESAAARQRTAEERKALLEAGDLPETRPSKRDRRQIARFRGRA